MSTLRHGKIERAIAAEIADAANSDRFRRIGPVHIRSDQLVDEVYCPEDARHGWNWADWKPTLAQRKAVTRAMRSFVRKHQQYALTGGQGRRERYLYDTADPVSVMWAKLNAVRRRRNPVSRGGAEAAVRRERDDRGFRQSVRRPGAGRAAPGSRGRRTARMFFAAP